MKLAETVTFGGSGLNRAAEMRGRKDAQILVKSDITSRAIVLWRGKPLIRRARPAQLVRLRLTHPLVAENLTDALFLGTEDGEPRIAVQIDNWQPEDQDLSTLNSFLDPTEQRHPLADAGEVFAELRKIMTWLSARDAELAATAKGMFAWHGTHRFCARCGAPSEISQFGWQRECTACGASHFPRTDPVVIMLITYGNSCLLGRSPGWPQGMYSCLAGFVEPGETIEAAVRREVFEEAGVRVGPVRYLSSQPWPFPNSLMFGCAGEATSREITLDPDEIEDAQWVSREDLALAFAGNHPWLSPARKGAIAHFLLENWLADRLD